MYNKKVRFVITGMANLVFSLQAKITTGCRYGYVVIVDSAYIQSTQLYFDGGEPKIL